MMKPIRVIIFTWLAWALLLMGFQAWATARYEPQFPDRAQDWTIDYASASNYEAGQIYLIEPFLNDQVAWDSEYYLAIAVGGYDDPAVDIVGPPEIGLTKSYAFFPFYPTLMRWLSHPLRVFGLNPIATAALAGVIISGLGTLAGMLALFDLARDSLGVDGALRATFYLIIFPTGFFLIQVYTEGLFVGLAFGCLAMLKRKHWLAAAILGSCATLTRAVGFLLIIPMVMTWFRSGEWLDVDVEWKQIVIDGVPWRPVFRALMAFAPLITFIVWKFSYLGLGFDFVQENFFGRGILSLGSMFRSWSNALSVIGQGGSPQSAAYFLTEFLGLGIGIAACFVTFKTHPEIAWFSLMVMVISLGSGPIQGIHRYILGAPSVFIALAQWGRNPVFDRAWTILSMLLMGALSVLFAFNMWVA
jgi:hypothetical protein